MILFISWTQSNENLIICLLVQRLDTHLLSNNECTSNKKTAKIMNHYVSNTLFLFITTLIICYFFIDENCEVCKVIACIAPGHFSLLKSRAWKIGPCSFRRTKKNHFQSPTPTYHVATKYVPMEIRRYISTTIDMIWFFSNVHDNRCFLLN